MDQISLESNTEALRAAEEVRKNQTDSEVALLRLKAKTNLFWLGQTVLGYDQLSVNFHGHVSTWCKITNRDQYRIFLEPRAHFKSTLQTITDTVQIVLPDDSGNQPHPRNLGTNCRVGIVHEVADQAAKFLASITRAFRLNEYLIALFPECVPGTREKINKFELELPRTKPWGETTISALGIGASGQGLHFNFLKLDDIYGKEARDSPAAHNTTLEWLDNIQSFLVTPKEDHIDFIGTRYKKDDVYSHILDVYGERLKRYIRPIWERNSKNERVFIFPEKFDWESVQVLMKNRKLWNAQYMNNPLTEEAEFQQDWERYYERSQLGDSGDLIISNEQGIRKENIWQMDRLIFVDPATTGNSGIVVTGTDSVRPHSNVYILDAIQGIFNPRQLIDEIFRLVTKYRVRKVIIEEVLFSAVYQGWLASEQQMKGLHFAIEGAKTFQKAKEDRVRGLQPWFSNGQIYFHKSHEDLIEQFRYFGSIKEYHILDALAYGPRYWRAAVGSDEIARRAEAIAKFAGNRDRLTGYSRIT